jgi:hypothetical protein
VTPSARLATAAPLLSQRIVMMQKKKSRTGLTPKNRRDLARCGIPKEAIYEIESLIANSRGQLSYATPGKMREDLKALAKPVDELQEALATSSERTIDLLDISNLRPFVDELARSIKRLRKSKTVTRLGGAGDVRQSIATQLCDELRAHGVEVDIRPQGPANIALQIVFERLGLEVAETRNYLRPKRPPR